MIELLDYTCGTCNTANRLKVQRILFMQASPKCGQCKQPLFRAMDQPFTGLDAVTYTHPLDRETLATLQKVPGFTRFFTAIIKHSFEQDMRLHQMANFLRVDETQVPSLYKQLRTAADRLGVSQLPELYLYQHPVLNAYTAGVDRPFIAVSTACLEMLTDEELMSVMAHELGHVHAAHSLYKTAMVVLSLLAANVAHMTLGVGGLLWKSLHLALARWDRASELTADRAQLLVVRKPEVVLRTLMKMSGASPRIMAELNINAFIAQAESFELLRDESAWSKFLVFMQTIDRSHPFSVYRAKEVLEFCTTGEFLEILDGDYTRTSMVTTTPCPRCQKPMPTGAVICTGCAYSTQGEEPEGEKDKASLGDRIDDGVDEAIQWFKKTFGNT